MFSEPDSWRWGGCSDNVQYGVWFAAMFVDAAERVKIDATQPQGVNDGGSKSGTDAVKAVVNLHNNEVGRKVNESTS